MRRVMLFLGSFVLLWGLLAWALAGPGRLSLAGASVPVAGKPSPGPGQPGSRSPATGGGLDRVQGPPTIGRAQTDQLLCEEHSPACGTGQVLYAVMEQAGINPAFALAVFWHESHFGRLGVARQTHSLGNIRCTPGWPRCQEGYRWYPSWQESYADFAALLTREYFPRGLLTVEQIVPVYAPAADGNNPAAYISDVLMVMDQWRQR